MDTNEPENAIGRYRILDNEAPQDRQFLVIEDTDKGPVVWAGPFETIWAARATMRQLAARDATADEQRRRRRNDRHGGVQSGGFGPPPKKDDHG
jgi:hypothetical protein